MYTTYPQNHNYGPQHNGYGYAPQQPMPVAAPVAQSSTANMAADGRRPGRGRCSRLRRGRTR